ncbi:MAG: IPT/TIG domain-containing protein, partial [Puniceicoccales bacterium]|nr:IPT/TIG domain-containing protein [Puniceicoccales bacterium]
SQIPQNGSEVYTIAMSVNPNGTYFIPNSCSAHIVIDGEIYKMDKSSDFEYSYEYARSADQHKVNYYYEIDYKRKINGSVREKSQRSKLYGLTIVNRYIVGFESNRGVPGSRITLLGRGFEEGDYVEIGGVPCETTFVSSNSLSFVVPILGHGNKYHAKLVSDNGDIGLGIFHIDRVSFHSNLSNISLESGEKQILVISVNFDAPQEGIAIDVTTNIPDSIIMKDIFIPAGARSTSVIIQGGIEGLGMLYLAAAGFEELKIPVEVISSKEGTNATIDDAINDD